MIANGLTLDLRRDEVSHAIQILFDLQRIAGLVVIETMRIGESVFFGDLRADLIFFFVADASQLERNAGGFAFGIGDEIKNWCGRNGRFGFRALQEIKRDTSSNEN